MIAREVENRHQKINLISESVVYTPTHPVSRGVRVAVSPNARAFVKLYYRSSLIPKGEPRNVEQKPSHKALIWKFLSTASSVVVFCVWAARALLLMEDVPTNCWHLPFTFFLLGLCISFTSLALIRNFV